MKNLIVYWISYVVFGGPLACAYILSAGDLNKELRHCSSTCPNGLKEDTVLMYSQTMFYFCDADLQMFCQDI